MSDQTQTAGDERGTLSRELGEFLIELSIGVHRYAMYPASHPSLEPVVDRILGRLSAIFVDRRRLSIGVAQRQLVIDGAGTDPKHPVLSDLACRLHDHRLAALELMEGISSTEVEELLSTVAADTERGAEPVGLRPLDEIPRWDRAVLRPVGYGRLVLVSDEEATDDDRADRLWLDLARSVLSDGDPDRPPTDDPAQLARTIRTRKDAEYDQVIARYLRDLAEELRSGSSREAEKVRRRVADLIEELDEESLGRVLEMGGSPAAQKEFLLDAAHSLSVDAVLKVLRTTAKASGQEVSHSFTRMLSKLAAQADDDREPVRTRSDTALRENVEELIQSWNLTDPNPSQYTALLDGISRTSPVLEPREGNGDDLSAAHRILDMALEVDAYGPTVEEGISNLLDRGEGSHVLDRLGDVAEDHGAGARIREFLSTPVRLQQILSGTDIHEEALHQLVTRMGDTAIDPLLDVLTASDSRSVRRKVFDVVATLGEPVSARAVSRLEDERWYVVRNMLALLHRIGWLPDDFDPVQYTWYEDRRVRREALVLSMKDDRLRDWAVAEALSDDDERLVRIGLQEVRDRVPETVVPMIVNRVVRGERSPELRALAATALGSSRSSLARDALIEMASQGRSLFGRSASSPDVMEALSVLARVWPDDENSARVLSRARRSKDPALREAAGGTA